MKKLPLRQEAILPRINGISRNIQKLQKLAQFPLSEFEKREDIFDLTQHHLRLALEGVFHIGSHLLSRVPGKRATSYRDIAQLLGETGIVEQQFANDALIKMAGYRTRLTHFYHDITPQELSEIIRHNISDIEKFLQAVKKVLQDPQNFGFTLE